MYLGPWLSLVVTSSPQLISPVKKMYISLEPRKSGKTYAANQGRLLLHTIKTIALCINKSRSYHRKRLNELRPDPCPYVIGNLVLARCSVKSDNGKNIIDKTTFAYTSPCVVTKKLKDTPYKVTHAISKKITSKHATHMSPVPPDIQAFVSLDSVDSCYGQLYRTNNRDAYKQGGIEGFLPNNPFKGFNFCRDTMQMGQPLLSGPVHLPLLLFGTVYQSCHAWTS